MKYSHKIELLIIYKNYSSESTPPSLLSSELATPRQISTIITDGMLNNQSDELKKLKVIFIKSFIYLK